MHRVAKRHCMIILFDAIIPSPDLVTTPLHAIRGDFFFLSFFDSLAIIPGAAVVGRSIRTRNEIIHISMQSRIVMLKEKATCGFFLFFYFFIFFPIPLMPKRCILSSFSDGA